MSLREWDVPATATKAGKLQSRIRMKSLVLAALRGYRRYLSPVLPISCRYVPTCSEYAMEAVERHGVVRGLAQALRRFLRCNPFAGHGYDPVVE